MRAVLLAAALSCGLAGCADRARLGMVVDPGTGLLAGSRVDRNIVVDPSQFENRRIKVAIRNTSGDVQFDLHGAAAAIERRLAEKGYVPVQGDDFGILLDVNVLYSGQASEDRAAEFGLLGAAGGTVAGLQAARGVVAPAAGLLAGATLGSILGSFVRDETYLVVADVSIGVIDPKRGVARKTILMESSIDRREEAREQAHRHAGMRPFGSRERASVAVYAGGRNVPQDRIADGVRQRLLRIVGDVI